MPPENTPVADQAETAPGKQTLADMGLARVVLVRTDRWGALTTKIVLLRQEDAEEIADRLDELGVS